MAESTSTPAERIARNRALLHDARADSRGAQRLRKNRNRNEFLGIGLHAAARHSRGLPLSDLEQTAVDILRMAVTDEEIVEYGRTYLETSVAHRSALLPDRIANLAVEEPYSMLDFAKDLPAMVEEITAQPNFRRVNVDDLPEGAGLDPADAGYRTAAEDYGNSMVLYTGTPPAEDAAPAAAIPSFVSIRLMKFYCVSESAELSGSDEIYWVVASGGDAGSTATYKSRVFGSVDKGKTYPFDSHSMAFTGTFRRNVTMNIQCWEQDHGAFWSNISKALFKVAEAALQVAVDATEAGVEDEAVGLVVLAAAVFALLGWLSNLFKDEDDLVEERNLCFSPTSLERIRKMPGRQDYWNFSSHRQGHQQLYLSVTERPAVKSYRLKNKASGLYLHTAGRSDQPSAHLEQWHKEPGSAFQVWQVVPLANDGTISADRSGNLRPYPGGHLLVNKGSGYSAVVDSLKTTPSAAIQQWHLLTDGTQRRSQTWLFQPEGDNKHYLIQNQHSGLYLTVSNNSTAPSGHVEQYGVGGAAHLNTQLWMLEPAD